MFRGLKRSISRGIGSAMHLDPMIREPLNALGLGSLMGQGQAPQVMGAYQQPDLGLAKNSAAGPTGQQMGGYLNALEGQDPMQSAIKNRRIQTKGSF